MRRKLKSLQALLLALVLFALTPADILAGTNEGSGGNNVSVGANVDESDESENVNVNGNVNGNGNTAVSLSEQNDSGQQEDSDTGVLSGEATDTSSLSADTVADGKSDTAPDSGTESGASQEESSATASAEEDEQDTGADGDSLSTQEQDSVNTKEQTEKSDSEAAADSSVSEEENKETEVFGEENRDTGESGDSIETTAADLEPSETGDPENGLPADNEENDGQDEEETAPGGFMPVDYEAPRVTPQETEAETSVTRKRLLRGTASVGASVTDSEYDPRSTGIITSVKNQGNYETCWAFASMSAAETSMLKKGNVTSPDYSEKHLAWFMYNYEGINDPKGNTEGDYTVGLPSGGTSIYGLGGNQMYAAFALSGWMGAANQSDYPYMTSASDTIEKTKENYFNSVAHLQDFRFIDYDVSNSTNLTQDIRNIKQAILDYGSVVIGYYDNDNYRNGEAIYCNVKYAANHAVTLVGWDNSYLSTKFKSGRQPDENGAWIVKNSWGTEQGDNGYFYLSYYDKTISNPVAFSYEKADNYDSQYFYDGSTGLSAYYGEDKYANVFTVDENAGAGETLKAVSVAFDTANVSYSIQIYKNPDSGDPASGETVCTMTGLSTTFAGLYTVPLTTTVSLSPGDTFSVVVDPKNDSDAIFIDQSASSSWIKFVTSESQGQSYEYNGYYGWRDLGSQSKTARIRAYTTTSFSVTLAESSYIYDKKAKEPGVTVSYGGKTLTKGTDYNVSYKNNTDAGTATVIVTGTGEYAENSAEKTFTITPRTIATEYGDKLPGLLYVMLAGDTAYYYTGNSIEPAILGKYYETTLFGSDYYQLVKGKDYTVVYKNNVSVGTATATMTGIGNFAGTKALDFTIQRTPSGMVATPFAAPGYSDAIESGTKVILGCQTSGASIYYSLSGGSGSVSNKLYTGTPVSIEGASNQSVTLTIYAKKEGMKESAKNTYTYTIEDEYGDITDSGDQTFYKTLSNKKMIWVRDIEDQTYTGFNITLESIGRNVYYGNKLLTKGTDYTVSYKNNKKAGTATVTVTGKGNYSGTTKESFTINPVDLGSGDAALTLVTGSLTLPYSKKAQKPSPAVYYNGISLKKGTDYTIAYYEDEAATKLISGGLQSNETSEKVYYIKYTGKGNFKGTDKGATKVTIRAKGTAVYPISKAKITFTDGSTYYYQRSEIKPGFTVSYKTGNTTNPLEPGKDYLVTYLNNTGKGTGKIVITGMDPYTGTLSKTFKIKARSLADPSVSAKVTGDVTYVKGGVKPAIEVKYGEKVLEQGTDYTVSYSNNKAVGKTVKCVIKGKGNYSGSKTIYSSAITTADLAKQTLILSDMKYTEKENKYKAVPLIVDANGNVLKAGTDYDKSYVYEYDAVNGKNDHKAGEAVGTSIPDPGELIRVTVTGKNNYAGSVIEGTYQIAAETETTPFSKASVKIAAQAYTGQPVMPCGDSPSGDLTVKIGKTPLTSNTDYEIVTYINNVKKGNAYIVLKGKGRYYGTKKVKFKINAYKN